MTQSIRKPRGNTTNFSWGMFHFCLQSGAGLITRVSEVVAHRVTALFLITVVLFGPSASARSLSPMRQANRSRANVEQAIAGGRKLRAENTTDSLKAAI